jgi:hypothetical protein
LLIEYWPIPLSISPKQTNPPKIVKTRLIRKTNWKNTKNNNVLEIVEFAYEKIFLRGSKAAAYDFILQDSSRANTDVNVIVILTPEGALYLTYVCTPFLSS